MIVTRSNACEYFPEHYLSLVSAAEAEIQEIADLLEKDTKNLRFYVHKALPILIFLELPDLQKICESFLKNDPESADEKRFATKILTSLKHL